MNLIRNFIAGLIVSLVAIAFYISCAALLFQGPLAEHLATGIGIALAGGAMLALLSAWKSSIVLSSVGPEPATIPVVAGMTAVIAVQCSATQALPTAVVALALVSLIIGVVWFLLGYFGAGNVIRYIPYPVIGGFLGAVGWLMFSGGLGVVVGKPFSLELVPELLTRMPSAQLVTGTLVATVLWFATQRIKHVLTMPVVILGFALLIHLWLRANAIGLDAARADGWLMREFSLALPMLPLSPELLGDVNWKLILHESGVILSATVVSTIGLLLSDSSLEVAFDERADLNHDLKLLGIGNSILSLVGGLVGGISISRSILNREAGATGRIAGLVKAIACVAAMLVGGPLIALVPKAALGGILMFMGIGMLKAWLVDGRKRLAGNDYFVVLVIVVLTVFVGYLPAVIAGIVVCCFDFAISMARQSAIRREFSRNAWPSSIERNGIDDQQLQAIGERVQIIELQGTLFFGSMRSVAYHLEQRMSATDPKLDQMILDFKRVAEIDSSAAQAMARILKSASRHHVVIVLCGLSPVLQRVLKSNGVVTENGPWICDDVDDAIHEWEDRQLATIDHSGEHDLRSWLRDELGSQETLDAFIARLDRISLQSGELLFNQGESADSLYLVESGRLLAIVERHGGMQKVRKIQAGGTVGEMGMYRAGTRSATVRAEMPSTLLRVSRHSFDDLEIEAPDLAIRVHKLFVRSLATRLEHANAQAAVLSG